MSLRQLVTGADQGQCTVEDGQGSANPMARLVGAFFNLGNKNGGGMSTSQGQLVPVAMQGLGPAPVLSSGHSQSHLTGNAIVICHDSSNN